VRFHVLRYHGPHRELGGNYFDERKKEAVVNHPQQRLQKLGYQAQLQTVASA